MLHDLDMDWSLSPYRTHVDETLEEVQEAAKEWIQLWADIGDLGKLADAWPACERRQRGPYCCGVRARPGTAWR